jgi:hypothetical protein
LKNSVGPHRSYLSRDGNHGIDHVPLETGVVLRLQFPLPVHGLPTVIVPLTVTTLPPFVPVAVKLGVVGEPEAVPDAVVPSMAEPVPLDATQVTAPLAVPLSVAETAGGDDQVRPSVLIRPVTVAVRLPQSAILGMGGAGVSSHMLMARVLTSATAVKKILYIDLPPIVPFRECF